MKNMVNKLKYDGEALDAFHAWLNEMYGSIEICGKTFSSSDILFYIDEGRYNKSFYQFIEEQKEEYDLRN